MRLSEIGPFILIIGSTKVFDKIWFSRLYMIPGETLKGRIIIEISFIISYNLQQFLEWIFCRYKLCCNYEKLHKQFRRLDNKYHVNFVLSLILATNIILVDKWFHKYDNSCINIIFGTNYVFNLEKPYSFGPKFVGPNNNFPCP